MNKFFSITKKIITVILLVIIIPVVLFNLIIITKSVIFKDKSPSVFGYKYFTVLTGSMEPTINVGDLVIVKESSYAINDIISYKDGNSVVTHRIIDYSTQDNGEIFYTTKGDNNNAEDEFPVSKENVDGKVIKVIPKLGNIILFLRKNVFYLLILLVVVWVLDSKKEKNK